MPSNRVTRRSTDPALEVLQARGVHSRGVWGHREKKLGINPTGSAGRGLMTRPRCGVPPHPPGARSAAHVARDACGSPCDAGCPSSACHVFKLQDTRAHCVHLCQPEQVSSHPCPPFLHFFLEARTIKTLQMF